MEKKITLSKKDRKEIVAEAREELKKQLDGVPDGTRITFDNEHLEILEDLIFDYYDVELGNCSSVKEEYRGKKVRIKYIALEGKYLSKLDLSKVSFENVVWGGSDILRSLLVNCKYDLDDVGVDLSGTNAIIDFSQSAFSKYLDYCICFSYCNFKGLDLSQNNLSRFFISDSNFEGTNIGLIYKEGSGKCTMISNSNMDGLKTFEKWPVIGVETFFQIVRDISKREFSSFNNTGLKIDFSISNPKLFRKCIRNVIDQSTGIKRMELSPHITVIDRSVRLDDDERYYLENREYVDFVISMVNMMRQGKLSGCELNGRKIPSPVETLAKKAESQGIYKKVRSKKREGYFSAINKATGK